MGDFVYKLEDNFQHADKFLCLFGFLSVIISHGNILQYAFDTVVMYCKISQYAVAVSWHPKWRMQMLNRGHNNGVHYNEIWCIYIQSKWSWICYWIRIRSKFIMVKSVNYNFELSNNAVMDRIISCFLAVVYANCFRKQLLFLKSSSAVWSILASQVFEPKTPGWLARMNLI
jgi:hypothetical protein